jgi:hypothetical protein
MEKQVKEKVDLDPLFAEILKTQSYVRALASVSLSKKQKKEYDKKYRKLLSDITDEFKELYPGVINDPEKPQEKEE